MGKFFENFGMFFIRVTACITLITLHGWGKLKNPTGFSEILKSKGIIFPELLSYLSLSAETVFPLLIIFGFLTRFSAFITSLNMFVATFVFHIMINSDPVKVWEKPFLYMVVFMFITITGGGDFTLDHFLSGKKKRSRWRSKF